MPSIEFKNVSKSYGSTRVIESVDAFVPDESFLVLLGPSGCGKSTLLRMVAGLTDITGGQIEFDGRVVNDLPPKKRDIAFVFQSYALYPHMSVRANIAFPLVMDRFKLWHHIPFVGGLARRALMRSPEVAQRVSEVAEMLELAPYLDRKPKALSGGQRQRVALARSLVRDPDVFLLDEPLSNLDAKLRSQMRSQLTALHDRIQKTFVYVTHDQVEAMTMGTHILVFNAGLIQQYGAPEEVYKRPANTFVAKFIGAPPMNLLPATAERDGVTLEGLATLDDTRDIATELLDATHSRVLVGIRPENVVLALPGEAGSVAAKVVAVERLGAESLIGLVLGDRQAEAESAHLPNQLFYSRVSGDPTVDVGDIVGVQFDMNHVSWFDAQSELRIRIFDVSQDD